MNVSVSPEAERELMEGATFYAERGDKELGLAFISEFEHAVDLLSTNPEIGALWRGSTRRVLYAACHTMSLISCGSWRFELSP